MPFLPLLRRARQHHVSLEIIMSRCATPQPVSNIPMTSKNALGSMPRAEEKSVPVFFRECIAARIPCTAATQETSEKTEKVCQYANSMPNLLEAY